MGRFRQIIFILALTVKQAGFLALLMQFLVKLKGNATLKKKSQTKKGTCFPRHVIQR